MSSILKLLRVRFTEPETPSADHRPREHVRLTNPWHAVSIVPANSCCSAARDLVGKRYLSSDAPPALPLPSCPRIACHCRYRHHDDRRGAQRETLQAVPARALARRADDPPSH